ncbi:MAG: hypothetical protein HZC40_10480 [Chloroflexi bacterium]|nr:hypothetical protein [Chloroflexota bacterium]
MQDSTLIAVIETLMAFRHVATKIYGFLIDWGKLKSVVEMIVVHHARIVSLFESTSAKLSEASMQNGE